MRRSERLSLIKEFEDLYKKERQKKSEKEIINQFFARHPKLSEKEKEELKEEILFSIFLFRTLSFRPMPEQISKRVEERIRRKWAEIGQERKGEKTIPLTRRTDFLILLFYLLGKIKGITRIMKYLFLLSAEKGIGRYLKDYYQFIPHQLGPFDKRVYTDLENLRKEGLIEKIPLPRISLSEIEREIFNLFEKEEGVFQYQLTEKGREFAKKIIKGIDKEIIRAIQEVKGKYGRYPLLKLLEEIYLKYPEYQAKSKVFKEIKRFKEGKD
jgi:hypothetical protein